MMIIICLFLILAYSQLISIPTQITNSIECYSCVKRSDSKICYSTYSSSNLWCCEISDTSLYWGGGTGDLCNKNNSSSEFPDHSEYTMCSTENSWGKITILFFQILEWVWLLTLYHRKENAGEGKWIISILLDENTLLHSKYINEFYDKY